MAARLQQEQPADAEVIPADVFVGIPGERFARWQQTRVMKRGAEYDNFKQELIQKTMVQLERTWPGLGRHIRFLEGATPRTIESCNPVRFECLLRHGNRLTDRFATASIPPGTPAG